MALARVILLLSLGACGLSQRPALNLFREGGLQATFHAAVESGSGSLLLASNPDSSALVSGPLDRIVVRLGGAGEAETIEVSHESVLEVIAEQSYEYRFPPQQDSLENFNSLLATLRYVYTNLTSASLSQPPRNVTIVATDNSTGTFSDEAVAIIELQRANSGEPEFNQASYSAVIMEDASVNDLVTDEISASDPEGLAVMYSILESDFSSAFSIDPTSGEVRVANATLLDFDRPETPLTSVTISVVASDSDPIAALNGSVTLTVQLTNINDNPPVFTSPSYTFDTPENVLQARVGNVSATDLDDLEGLRYSFVDPLVGSVFVIGRDFGDITVIGALDFEQSPSYTFQVQVTDGTFSDTASVNVRVADVADNRPLLTPLSSDIFLDLDAGERTAALSSGNGGTHSVEDDSALLNGSARVYFLRNGVVSVRMRMTAHKPRSQSGNVNEYYTYMYRYMFTCIAGQGNWVTKNDFSFLFRKSPFRSHTVCVSVRVARASAVMSTRSATPRPPCHSTTTYCRMLSLGPALVGQYWSQTQTTLCGTSTDKMTLLPIG